MKLNRRAIFGTITASTLALSLAACGGGDDDSAGGDGEGVSGEITASGASFPDAFYAAAIDAYADVNPDLVLTYNAVGSGTGKSEFGEGINDFAGTDSLVGDDEGVEAGSYQYIPTVAAPITVSYNLPDVEGLQLSQETLAQVFQGDIAKWNDEAIAADNPDVDLPDLPVVPVSRSDESGTTENFTAYLAAAAPPEWPHEPDGQWPFSPVEAGQGNSGVAQAIRGGQGTIGYLEASHAEGMPTARIGQDGEFVALSPESAAQIVAVSPRRPGGGPHDHALALDYTATGTDAYPIVLVSYEIACLAYDEEAEAEGVKAFLGYLLSDEGQQAASEESGSAPLAPRLRDELLASVEAIGVR